MAKINTATKGRKQVKNAKVGDSIYFTRKKLTIFGTVQMVRDNSVIVEIGPLESVHLGIPGQSTVVAHKNYVVI